MFQSRDRRVIDGLLRGFGIVPPERSAHAMREHDYGLLAVPPLLSPSSGGDLVHGDNIMVFPHTLDAYMATQKMLLPAKGQKPPLPTG